MDNSNIRNFLNRFWRVDSAIWILTVLILLSWPQLTSNLLNNNYMPHVHCFLDSSNLLWLHLSSDISIGLSYIAISIVLVVLVLKAKPDIPFPSIFLAFGLFIISCGATHLMEVWTLWDPVYWLSGGIKLVTAAASLTTAIALPFTIPKVLEMIRRSKTVEEKTMQLEKINIELEKHVNEKEKTEDLLKKAHNELELRVKERTLELEKTNADLREEIRRHEKTQQALKWTEARLSGIFHYAMDAIISIDAGGAIVLLNEAAMKMFICNEQEALGRPVSVFIPAPFQNILNNGADSFDLKLTEVSHGSLGIITGVRSTGEEFPIEGSISGSEVGGEKIYTFILRDITGRKKSEEKIEASLKEKEVLLKEVHHRVKNNLQIISSLLNLQSNYIEDKEALEVFKESQNRIKSMALIHEKLYQSGNLSRVNIKDYIKDLSSKLFSSYRHESKKIRLILNIQELYLEVDKCIAIGLILNELISNSLKHAFIDTIGGELLINLHMEESRLVLVVADNGSGLPVDFDLQNTETLGLQLVFSLIDQHNGSIEYGTENGTKFLISFTIA